MSKIKGLKRQFLTVLVPTEKLRKKLLSEGTKSLFALSSHLPSFAHLLLVYGHDEDIQMYSADEEKPVDIVSKTFVSL